MITRIIDPPNLTAGHQIKMPLVVELGDSSTVGKENEKMHPKCNDEKMHPKCNDEKAGINLQ